MRLFDILGPVMVGPSSSHTAGAVRIGLTARKLLGDQPVHADISLHGSFALTGHGHGTDCALIAGLLGMQPDDLRIPGSFAIAAEQGLTFAFQNVQLRNAHPNTARLQLTDAKAAHWTLWPRASAAGAYASAPSTVSRRTFPVSTTRSSSTIRTRQAMSQP